VKNVELLVICGFQGVSSAHWSWVLSVVDWGLPEHALFIAGTLESVTLR
jgi:hypothetical protein